MADFEGDTYSGVPFITPVRYVFTRDIVDFFDVTANKRFSKGIVRIRVIRK